MLQNLVLNNTVETMTETSDSIYIGGDFTSYFYKSDYSNYGAIVNSTNADFIKGFDFNGPVFCSIIDGDYIYFGGGFTKYQGIDRQYIVKVHRTTGAIDENFNTSTGFTNTVSAMFLDSINRKLYVGGQFTSYKGNTRNYLAKLNADTAALDATFNPGNSTNGGINSLFLNGSELFVGGSFTTYRTDSCQNLALVSATDASLIGFYVYGAGANGTVNGMISDGLGNLYIGGNFETYTVRLNGFGASSATNRSRIIKINLTTKQPIDTFDPVSINRVINSIALDSDKNVYIGGDFDSVGGVTCTRIAKLNSNGVVYPQNQFNVSTGSATMIRAVAVDNNNDVYVGGQFTTIQGSSRQRIAKLSGTNGSLLSSFDTTSGFTNTALNNNVYVYSINIDSSGKLYVGGDFNFYKKGPVAANRLLKISKLTNLVDTTFNIGTGFNNTVKKIVLGSSDNLYVGGRFTSYKGNTRNFLVKLNSNTGADKNLNFGQFFNQSLNGAIWDLTIDDAENLYLVGQFTTGNGGTKTTGCRGLAKISGVTGAFDFAFDSGTGYNNSILGYPIVRSVVLTNRKLIQLTGTTTASSNTITVPSTNNIEVGMCVDMLGVNVAQVVSVSPATNTVVIDVLVPTSGVKNITFSGALLVGGNYDSYKGAGGSNKNITKINAYSGVSVGTGLNLGGVNNQVTAIKLDANGDYCYIGGSFTTVDGTSRGRIARFNPRTRSASLDALLFAPSTGFNSDVLGLDIDSSNNLYVVGSFTSYNGSTRNRIAKLNANNAQLDASFNPGTGFNDSALSVLVDSSQRVHVGGSFTTYQSLSASKIISLITSSSEIVPDNSPPTDIALSSYNIAENAGANAVVGALSATDAEGGVMSWALVAGAGDTHNSLFNISGSNLRANASFDYENMPAGAAGKTLSVRVQATDAGGLSYSKAFTINVTDVNEQPSGITLSGAVANAKSIAENNAIGAVIGTLSAIDPDTGDTPTLSIQSGADKFEIVGNQLRAKVAFDYETATSHSVTVRATDAGGLTRDETFVISVINEEADDPVDAQRAIALTGNKVYMRSAKNPKAIPHRFNNAPIVEGSVVVYPANGQQKYYKFAGSSLNYYQIPITVPNEWNWDQEAKDAWAVLQSFN